MIVGSLSSWFPSILQALTIIRPETLVRWHRAGFRCYWRWKSLPLGGRPQIETKLRVLIRRMSMENPLWGAACTDNFFLDLLEVVGVLVILLDLDVLGVEGVKRRSLLRGGDCSLKVTGVELNSRLKAEFATQIS
jgi:hypothetical protein